MERLKDEAEQEHIYLETDKLRESSDKKSRHPQEQYDVMKKKLHDSMDYN